MVTVIQVRRLTLSGRGGGRPEPPSWPQRRACRRDARAPPGRCQCHGQPQAEAVGGRGGCHSRHGSRGGNLPDVVQITGSQSDHGIQVGSSLFRTRRDAGLSCGPGPAPASRHSDSESGRCHTQPVRCGGRQPESRGTGKFNRVSVAVDCRSSSSTWAGARRRRWPRLAPGPSNHDARHNLMAVAGPGPVGWSKARGFKSR